MEPRSPAPSNAPPHTPTDDTVWHALVDGQLPAREAQRAREQLRGDESAHAAMAQWQLQRERLRALHQDLLEAPVPDSLRAAAARADRHLARQGQWWRRGGMAASVLLAFTLGWTGRGQWSAGPAGHAPVVQAQAPMQHFAQQAAVAHAVYQPEVRHPVEVTAAQQDHLVQWLSKRLNRPLKVPTLSALGYELVGGRLLPGDTGARAQFMYQNAEGQRVTLYLGALAPTAAAQAPAAGASSPPSPPAAPTSPSAATVPAQQLPATAFELNRDAPVPAFYWADAGFGYALSGQLPRTELLALATAVYTQLLP